MKKTPLKVLITASGAGISLGDLTKYTNKTLIKIGKKPTLSYIIDLYPRNTEFVITIGHYAGHVRDFLRLVYPKLNIRIVTVDKYQGEGSSLAYSMLRAEKYLRCPFIYHASDTIVTEAMPTPSENWVAGFQDGGSSQYASFDAVDGFVQNMYPKGMSNPDFLHVGLVGVNNYQSFWSTMRQLHRESPNDESLGDLQTIMAMLGAGEQFAVIPLKQWHDVGNIESLNRVRQEIDDSFHILDKPTESIYLYDKFIVKFFHDRKTAEQRVKRAGILKGLVPNIKDHNNNFYQYEYVPGRLLSNVIQPHVVERFFNWAEQNLWHPVREVSDERYAAICHEFYYLKTTQRIQEFLETRGIIDEPNIINGQRVPKIFELLDKVDFENISRAEQTHFHGDFVLDNILQTQKGFCLLDWRQNFGGLLKAGDKYYDIAKFNHNLVVNHGIVNDNLFKIQISKRNIQCDILRRQYLVKCQEMLFQILDKRGYDAKKVSILSALIWLNMSPLHQHPFDLFLYYFGKLNLWYALQQKEKI